MQEHSGHKKKPRLTEQEDAGEILVKIPFRLDPERLMAQAHVESGSNDAADMHALIELAQEIGRPKAAYAPRFIRERDGDGIRIENVWFRSRMLAHNLKNAEQVFPHISTCGHELDRDFPGKGDMLKEFWWDLIKSHLLEAADKHLKNMIQHRFRLHKTVTMHPGSGNTGVWPIEQQKELFSLLGGAGEALGVRLTDSFLMIPNKTTSGLLFETEKVFHSCEVCHRANCISRQVPFNKQLWEELQHD